MTLSAWLGWKQKPVWHLSERESTFEKYKYWTDHVDAANDSADDNASQQLDDANRMRHISVNYMGFYFADHIRDKALETLVPIAEEWPEQKEDESGKYPKDEVDRNSSVNNTQTSQDDRDMVQSLDASFRTFSISDATSIGTWSTISFMSRKSMGLSSANTSLSSVSMPNNSDFWKIQQFSDESPLQGEKEKSASRKKPKDKLKRPMSAYAIFFKEERDRILKEEERNRILSEEERDRILTEGERNRTQGKLCQLILRRWQELDDVSMAVYESKASMAMERYKKETEVWDAKYQKENTKLGTIDPDDLALSRILRSVVGGVAGLLSGDSFGKMVDDEGTHPKRGTSNVSKSDDIKTQQSNDLGTKASAAPEIKHELPNDNPQSKTSASDEVIDHTIHKQNGEFDSQTGRIIPESAVGPADVKMGKSPTFRDQLGNKMLRNLIRQNYDQYYAGNKQQKTRIAEHIINDIRVAGGRFLKRPNPNNQSFWVVVNDVLKIRDKVASTFRSEKKKRRSEKERGEKRIPERLPGCNAVGDPLGLPYGDALGLPGGLPGGDAYGVPDGPTGGNFAARCLCTWASRCAPRG